MTHWLHVPSGGGAAAAFGLGAVGDCPGCGSGPYRTRSHWCSTSWWESCRLSRSIHLVGLLNPPLLIADAMLGELKGQLDQAVSLGASRGDTGDVPPPPLASGSGRRDADVASKWAAKDVSLIFDNLSVSPESSQRFEPQAHLEVWGGGGL